jgi:heme iron utilization protein
MTRDESIGITAGIMQTQNFGVLATAGKVYPYTSLVGFLAKEDLKTIIFATSRDSAKYLNLKEHPGVSILVTTSANQASDLSEAASVTALGPAGEAGAEREKIYREIYLAKFPSLQEFVEEKNTALIEIKVERYIIVTRFQQVDEFVP